MYQLKNAAKRTQYNQREFIISCQVGAVKPRPIGYEAYFSGTASNDNWHNKRLVGVLPLACVLVALAAFLVAVL